MPAPIRRALARLAAPLALLALLAAPLSAGAQEQPWPSRPITILGGFPNGSGVDIYARRLAEPLTRALGMPVVVDNRTGAGGNIASELVAKARRTGTCSCWPPPAPTPSTPRSTATCPSTRCGTRPTWRCSATCRTWCW